MAKHRAHRPTHRLFPPDLPVLEWTEFQAEGFSQPVSGLIDRSDSELVCGMLVGGVDAEANGSLAYCSMLDLLFPRLSLNTPRLGIASSGRVGTLTAQELSGVDCVEDKARLRRVTNYMACLIHGGTGSRYNGNDYYQGMIMWSLPAVLEDQDWPAPPAGRLGGSNDSSGTSAVDSTSERLRN